jgi:hypothetical protein
MAKFPEFSRFPGFSRVVSTLIIQAHWPPGEWTIRQVACDNVKVMYSSRGTRGKTDHLKFFSSAIYDKAATL